MDDMIGKRFGKWTVLSKNEEESIKRRPAGHKTETKSYYNCQCDCGNIGTIQLSSLRTGTSLKCKSCSIIERANKIRGNPWKASVTDHASYLKKMAEIHPNITVVGTYIKSTKHVELYCNTCNTTYFQSPNRSINHKSKCPQCKANNKFKKPILDNNGNIKEIWCSGNCKKYLSSNKFTKNKNNRSGYSSECKDCVNLRRNKRMAEDPIFHASILARRILKRTEKLGNIEHQSTFKALGYHPKDLAEHLEQDCMNRYGVSYHQNRDQFEIDHNKPLFTFDLTKRKNIKKANALSNLQVLTIEDHKVKTAEDYFKYKDMK